MGLREIFGREGGERYVIFGVGNAENVRFLIMRWEDARLRYMKVVQSAASRRGKIMINFDMNRMQKLRIDIKKCKNHQQRLSYSRFIQ